MHTHQKKNTNIHKLGMIVCMLISLHWPGHGCWRLYCRAEPPPQSGHSLLLISEESIQPIREISYHDHKLRLGGGIQ